MKTPLIQKSVLSPFVAVGFAVIAVTGVLLFFHIKNGSIMVLHEWFGWAFIATGLVHLLLNSRPLLSYFNTRKGIVSFCAALCLTVVLAIVGFNHEGGPHAGGPRTEQH
jgi:thiosulfate reductase cytochrome b subunit